MLDTLRTTLIVCTLCARSLKVQKLSFKDNNYHVVLADVWTITSDSVKYSGLFGSQDYCYAALLFGCELNSV